MKTVKQILDAKGYQVWSITPDKFVFDALKLMGEENIGALAVVEAERLVGIISERDYARKVILQGRTSRDTRVAEIMATMTARRIRHLPVVENDQLIGMISIGDLVKSIIDEQQFMIEQLENYISG